MTKIEEIIQEHVDPHVFKINGYNALEDAMKEYAEIYAKKVLEIAEENCCPDWIHPDDPEGESYIGIEPGSILNIKLPEHE